RTPVPEHVARVVERCDERDRGSAIRAGRDDRISRPRIAADDDQRVTGSREERAHESELAGAFAFAADGSDVTAVGVEEANLRGTAVRHGQTAVREPDGAADVLELVGLLAVGD